jgi:HNH endonuclease
MRSEAAKQRHATRERERYRAHRDPVAIRANIRRRADNALNAAEDVLAKLIPHWSGCLLWVGSYTKGRDGGYGWVRWQRKQVRVHRLVYEQYYGPIPNGMWVLHKCDTRNCANPDHLFLGTAKDNTNDMIKKGRAPFQVGTHREKYRNHCARGHEYTPENTTFRSKPSGRQVRVCKLCKSIIFKRFWARRRLANDLSDIAVISDERRNS